MRSLLALFVLMAFVAPAAAEEPRIDVDRLPIDIARIKQALKETTFREERDGLHLKYFITTYGQAPRIVIVPPDGRPGSWANGPVPYGAPTHRDFIEFWTPEEFRTPPMDFAAVIKWLAD